MSRSQTAVILFLLLTVIAGGALLTRPASEGGVGTRFHVPLVATSAVAAVDQPGAIPNAAPTWVPLVTATALAPSADGGEGSQAVYAADLQTQIPGGQAPVSEGAAPGWNPPPMEVPIAHQPFDHFWLIRPVAPNFNNFGLPHYAYGADGPASDLRIHHGIDLANPIGVEVFAAGDGTVFWSGKGSVNESEHEFITAYGNTVVIEHDFGFNGERIYTLYAHMSALLVETGQRVESGQVIGLIGNTGQVSGPHVHFEVRLGRNRYNAVQNPELWMAPYVGTGVIAGRVMVDDEEPAYDANILVLDTASGDVVYRTTTYSGPGVNSDPNWHETFVVPDVPEGRYLVRASHDFGIWSGEVEVVAGTTNWVDMVRTSSATPSPTP